MSVVHLQAKIRQSIKASKGVKTEVKNEIALKGRAAVVGYLERISAWKLPSRYAIELLAVEPGAAFINKWHAIP